MNICRALVIMVLAAVIPVTGNGQTRPSALAPDVDFMELADIRAKVNASLEALQDEIPMLENRLVQVRRDSLNLKSYKDQLQSVRAKQVLSAKDSSLADFLQARITSVEDSPPSSVDSLLRQRRDSLKNLQLLARDVQHRLSALVSPEEKFKLLMSASYAVLVGIVIVGFFVLAWRDDMLRRQVFGGDAGIQFLTLFSLVIAIILFGIIGVLQDKELAALLGGISGYILGRVSTGRKDAALP